MTGFSLPILLVLMYVTLVPCVVLFIHFRLKKKAFMATVFKGISAWIIICWALFISMGTPVSVFTVLVIAALAMGLAGDVALSLPGHGFTSGMLFFGIGHLCYIAALTLISGNLLFPLSAFVVLYAVALFIYKKSGIKIPDNLRIPVIIYSIIIASMISLAIASPIIIFPAGLILLFAGILFVISDALLAANGLSKQSGSDTPTTTELRSKVSLICYFLAQSLFAVSIYVFG